MGLFDKRVQKRAQELLAQQGSTGIPTYELTGLWASALQTGNSDIKRFRPAADKAGNASAVAARCLDLITQAAASRPLEVVTSAGEATEHYLEDLFNRVPNSYQSAVLFRTAIWQRLTTKGQVFIVLDRGNSRVDEPKSMAIHYGTVEVVISKPTTTSPHGEVIGYKVAIGKETAVLAPTEMLWIRFPDPAEPWGARAPMTAALDAIGLASAARAWQAGQLANGANPSGILYAGNPKDDEDYEAVRIEVEAALTGPSSAGRIAIMAGDPDNKPEFIRTSFTADEVGYLDTLNVAGEEIALALGVPLDLVGGQRTYANVEASWRILWEGTILPRLSVVSSEITRQLLSDTDLTALFNISDVAALQENQDALTTRVKAATESDIITIDEARAQLGYDPLPNGAGAVLLSEFRADIAPAVQEAPVRVSTDVDIQTRSEVSTNVDSPAEEFHVRGIDPVIANRDLDRLEAAARRAVVRLAKAQKADATKRLSRGRRSVPSADDVFNEALWLERAYEYLLPAVAAAIDAGAAGTAAALGADIAVDPYIAQAAESRALALAEQVNATTAQILRDRLAAAAIEDGLSAQQFSDILESTFDDLAGYRADTIARTEMVGGLNGGSRLAAVNSGVAVGRVWISTFDDRTRESHTSMNGKRLNDMDTPWTVGGTSLMYPGDPSGAAAETINCRCVEQYLTTLFE